MALSEIVIRNAKPKDKPYQLPDKEGLYLEVKPKGRGSGGFATDSGARKDGSVLANIRTSL